MQSTTTLGQDASADNNYYTFNLDNTTKDDFICMKLVCPVDEERHPEMGSNFAESFGTESSRGKESDGETIG